MPTDQRDALMAEATLDQALALLVDAGIAVASLRAPGRDGRGVLEADLLVAPDQREQAEALLVAEGFGLRPCWGRSPHRFLLRPLSDTGTAVDWLKLDIVSDLCFGPRHEWPTGLGATALRHRSDGPRPRLAAADELVALLLHALLDRGGLRRRDTDVLARLADEVDGPGDLARALTPPGDGPASWDRLVAAIRDGRDEDLLAAAPTLQRRVAARHRVRGASRALSRRPLRKADRVLGPVGRRAPLVALVGTDGTGKSTLVAGLVDASRVPARALYGGTYRSGTGSRVPGVATGRVLARLLATRAAITWHRRRGRLVILDRHPREAQPTGEDRLGRKARLRRSWVAATLPNPDLMVILDAPTSVLHERRPEHTVDHLERDRLRHLAMEVDAPTVVVDATQSPEAVRARTLLLIWQHAVASSGGAPSAEAAA